MATAEQTLRPDDQHDHQYEHAERVRVREGARRIREERREEVLGLAEDEPRDDAAAHGAHAAEDHDHVVSSRTTRRLVFVSHSGPDTWVAKQIAREIAARHLFWMRLKSMLERILRKTSSISCSELTKWSCCLLLGLLNGLTCGQRSGLRGVAAFRSWHCYSG